MKKFHILLFFTINVLLLNAQFKAILTLQKESRLIIHGSTNLLNFTLVQTGDDILNKPVPVSTSMEENKLLVNQNNLILKVKNFDSNNPIAESEFLKMMQTDKYPNLKIHLHHFEKDDDSTDNIRGNATISFTITGKTKTYIIPVKSSIRDNKLYMEGKKKMTIRDFGIEPPVALLGLVRVSEWIEIDFNLICEYKIV